MALILWDIDGTLIRAGSAGSRAFVTAIAAVTAVDTAGHGVVMSGKTDWLIALEILATCDVIGRAADALIPQVLDALADALSKDVGSIRREGRVLPGVEALTHLLSSSPGIVQTVLTGNIARNARTKLEPFGLDERLMLDVGAYGDDHVDRNVLVPFAWQRVRAATEVEHGADETWVIGDTPRDLACARAVGARCVLVATGHFDVRGNAVDFPNGNPGVNGVRVRQADTATAQLARGVSASNDPAVVLAANNPASLTEILGTVTVINNGEAP